MATYVLVHGAGDAFYWHLTEPRLRALGHDVIAPQLPMADDTAGFAEYADTVVEAIGDRRDLVVVAQSLGGFTGPLVCARVQVDLLVLVCAMTPKPGESAGEWWDATGQDRAMREYAESQGRVMGEYPDVRRDFFHDVPADVTEAVFAQPEPRMSDAVWAKPWPLEAWPAVPTRFLAGRHDRMFPLEFQRRIVPQRLGIEPDVIDTGHLPALARPDEFVARLEEYRTGGKTP
ncbi:alpha/beta hydrolase [Labedaea rhizosphaerae]|uniref:Pimeloyl-ACP methyl ester carboxylesterase n=1 Tax=Labedaea rhizosphaerae TaxID=598644 RepID=A0A4R6S0Q1_LABRH|nr:alpha/beta hydrolase [Labedaea rhizosphaerae]TDP92185.1 pimeloyl-ACP methyl ester carboxylesterase [Labedaea rhizosphaerae]